MSTYLFHKVDGKSERVLVEALDVERLLGVGYTVTEEAPKPKKKVKKATEE